MPHFMEYEAGWVDGRPEVVWTELRENKVKIYFYGRKKNRIKNGERREERGERERQRESEREREKQRREKERREESKRERLTR